MLLSVDEVRSDWLTGCKASTLTQNKCGTPLKAASPPLDGAAADGSRDGVEALGLLRALRALATMLLLSTTVPVEPKIGVKLYVVRVLGWTAVEGRSGVST